MPTAPQCCRSTLCDVEAGPWVRCTEQAQRTAPPMPTTDIRGGLAGAVIWCRSRRSSSATNHTMSRRYDRTVIFCRFEMVHEWGRSLRTRSVPVTPSTDPRRAGYASSSNGIFSLRLRFCRRSRRMRVETVPVAIDSREAHDHDRRQTAPNRPRRAAPPASQRGVRRGRALRASTGRM